MRAVPPDVDGGYADRWGRVVNYPARRVTVRDGFDLMTLQPGDYGWSPVPMTRRLRAAFDLAAWPVLATVSALLPRRLTRWLREQPDPDPCA